MDLVTTQFIADHTKFSQRWVTNTAKKGDFNIEGRPFAYKLGGEWRIDFDMFKRWQQLRGAKVERWQAYTNRKKRNSTGPASSVTAVRSEDLYAQLIGGRH